MSMFIILAVIARAVVTAITTWSIWRFRDVLNTPQRLGLGLIAGASFLTTAVIVDYNGDGTPFDVWAGLLLSIGIILFFAGHMHRLYGHMWRNASQKRAARDHFDRKTNR